MRLITRSALVLVGIAALVAFACVTRQAHAQFCGFPIAAAAGAQQNPTAVPDGAGGEYVSWQGDGSGAYVTRLLADGSSAPGWPAGGVLIGTLGQCSPIALGAAADGVVAAWPGPDGVRAQRVSALGISVWAPGGALVEALPNNPFNGVQVATDGNGGAYVAWGIQFGQNPPYTYGQNLQRIDAGGANAWSSAVAVSTTFPYTTNSRLIPTGHGKVLVASWATLYAPMIQTFALDGTHNVGTGFVAPGNCTIVGQTAADNGHGGAIVAYYKHCPVMFYASEVDSTAATLPGWTTAEPVASVNASQLSTTPDGLGGAYFAWTDNATHVPALMRLDGTGAPAAGWPAGGVPLASGAVQNLVIAPDGSGGAFAAWSRAGGTRPTLVEQHVLANGAIAPGYGPDGGPLCDVEPAPSCASPAFALVADAPGRATLVVSDSLGTGPCCPDLYGIHLPAGLVTPVTVAAVRTALVTGGIAIAWQTSAAGVTCIVERSRGGGWTTAAEVNAGADGTVAWRDLEASEGGRVGYRLRAAGATEAWSGSEVWVDVPASMELAILGARASGRELALTVHLPGSGARVALFDVAGRKLADRLIDAAAGTSRVAVSLQDPLRPGVYLARLTRGRQAVSRRFAVTP